MTTEEIKEGSDLIVLFLNNEFSYTFDSSNPSKGVYKQEDSIIPLNHWDWINKYQFHSSWDWLMPVVEKIELIDYVSVYFSKTYLGIHKIEISLHNPNYKYQQVEKTVFIKDNNKLQATFKAVVQFIKWYNDNKEYYARTTNII